MAGDWLKLDHDTPDKPEVIALANLLALPVDMVVGKLVRIWRWFDRHTVDGNARNVTQSFIDSLVAHEGFASALASVGWLKARDGAIQMPNFARHLGKSAKQRALGQERSKRFRNDGIVTPPSPEKRREEKKDTPKGVSKDDGKKFVKPTVEEVAAYCRERGNTVDPERFVAFYESKGWKVGKVPMTNWKMAITGTWEKDNPPKSKRPSAYVDPNSEEATLWNPLSDN